MLKKELQLNKARGEMFIRGGAAGVSNPLSAATAFSPFRFNRAQAECTPAADFPSSNGTIARSPAAVEPTEIFCKILQ